MMTAAFSSRLQVITEALERKSTLPFEDSASPFTHMDAPVETHCFFSQSVPPIPLTDYVIRLARYTGGHVEAFGAAVVLLDRVVARHRATDCPTYRLTRQNAHRYVAAAVLLALKLTEDIPITNKYYAQVSGLALSEVNRLEVTLLNALQWNTHVNPEDYDKVFKACIPSVQ
eukprot:PhF_6_TR32116/c5_g1_i3/m.47521